MSSDIFEICDVYKSFGVKSVLRGASLAVREGETITVMGESGSGKSVLLKMLVGLVTPDEGTILYRGRDVAAMDAEELQLLRREAGYVFQNDALFDSMSVLENVGYGLVEHTDQGDAEVRERVVECLTMVDLMKKEGILDSVPADLSGGMRRRVALARTIALQPKAIIYDEPMAGLDPQTITLIGRMILKFQRQLGATSVIATHEVETAFEISDRVAFLHQGVFAHVGTPVEMRENPAPEIHEFIDEAMARADAKRKIA